MVFTKIALAFAVLMAGQTSGDTIFTNLRSGRIPMGIQPDRIAEIRELKLFESSDHGRTWNEIDKITPDKEGGFKYAVPADGEYWYQVVAVNQQGREDPGDISKAAPMMKLLVDTKPPELKITSAQRQGDELVVSWAVREDNPDPAKLKLEYRTADSTVWMPISLVPGPTGTAKTTLSTQAAVVVRMQFKDLANNAASVEAQVAGNVAVTNFNSLVAPAAPQVLERGPAPERVQPPVLATAPPVPPLPPPVQSPLQAQASAPQIQPPMPQVQAPAPQVQPPMPVRDAVPSPDAAPPQLAPQPASPAATIASTTDNSQGSLIPSQTSSNSPRPMPQVQYVNDSEIIVEYELSRVGSSGLGSVDVWLTRDGGNTWSKYANDDNPALGTHDKLYQRSLKLPGEGTWGITLVVKSRAGLSKLPPRAGDAPEIVVEVDTTPPVADLHPLVADSQRHDTVLLKWTAKDRKLDDKAFTLEWAEQPAGPWHTIVAGLPSTTNSFAWQPPAGLPALVHLKLTVRDAAGNVAIAITRTAQPVDLNEPEGRPVRVIPANKK